MLAILAVRWKTGINTNGKVKHQMAIFTVVFRYILKTVLCMIVLVCGNTYSHKHVYSMYGCIQVLCMGVCLHTPYITVVFNHHLYVCTGQPH